MDLSPELLRELMGIRGALERIATAMEVGETQSAETCPHPEDQRVAFDETHDVCRACQSQIAKSETND